MTAFNGYKGHTRPYTHHNGHTVGSFQLVTNGVGNPDGLSDPAGIVSGAARIGVGVIYVTLKNRYAKIHVTASLGAGIAGAGHTVNAINVDGTGVVNVIALLMYNAAGAAADPNDVHITCTLNMYDSTSDS